MNIFADLLELRELRSLFAERYGNLLEPYVNEENLKANTPPKNIKLLLQLDIKLECDIEWDSTSLEQKLYKPTPFVQDLSQNANEKYKESLKPHHQNGLRASIQEMEKHQTEVPKKDDNALGNDLKYKSRAEVERKNEKHSNQAIGNSLPYKSNSEGEKKEEVNSVLHLTGQAPAAIQARVQQARMECN